MVSTPLNLTTSFETTLNLKKQSTLCLSNRAESRYSINVLLKNGFESAQPDHKTPYFLALSYCLGHVISASKS